MSGKNPYEKYYRTTNSTNAKPTERQCLVLFPSEGTHGIWPESLIRQKGRFGFEAKYGKQWFQCQVEKEGIA